MKISYLFLKVGSRIHRALLRFSPYQKLICLIGWDSFQYKTYYKTMEISEPGNVKNSDIDGYYNEGSDENIVRLVDHILSVAVFPRNVLDVGCGTGRYLKRMQQVLPSAYYTGIDISEEIIAKFSRKNVPQATFFVLDVEKENGFFVNQQNQFDLICLIGIVQILALNKIESVLNKMNGLLCNHGFLYIQFNVETLQKKTKLGYKRYSIEEMENLVDKLSLKIIKKGYLDILRDYAYIFAQKA